MTAFGRQLVCETCRDLMIEGEKASMSAYLSGPGVELLHCMQALETAEAGGLPVDFRGLLHAGAYFVKRCRTDSWFGQSARIAASAAHHPGHRTFHEAALLSVAPFNRSG